MLIVLFFSCFYFCVFVFFFFFQAEDGIRDGHVTGVQTCALPIFRVLGRDHSRRGRQRRSQDSRTALHRGVLPMRRRWLMRFHQGTVLLVAVLGLDRKSVV